MFVPRRLDKYLRDSTSLSLVEIREACLTGRVAVGSQGLPPSTVVMADSLIFESDIVALDGQVVDPRRQHFYLVLNKPRFVTATASDPTGRPDLAPWLRQMPKGVFPVGRLDRETSGALLFTNDGDLSNAILQPDHHTNKLYWLWIDEHLADDDPRLKALACGIQLDNGREPLRTVSAVVHHRAADTTELHVTLDEGKNRHIRKMCHVLRLHLLQLHRKSIGSLSIDTLGVGAWRELTAHEVEELWSSCGGRARVYRTKIAALAQMAKAAGESGTPNHRLEAWLEATSNSNLLATTARKRVLIRDTPPT